MTYTKQTTIWCDTDDCYEHYLDGSRTAALARTAAAGSGWTNHGRFDYCPEHGPADDSG
jgi:hypothetical protein